MTVSHWFQCIRNEFDWLLLQYILSRDASWLLILKVRCHDSKKFFKREFRLNAFAILRSSVSLWIKPIHFDIEEDKAISFSFVTDSLIALVIPASLVQRWNDCDFNFCPCWKIAIVSSDLRFLSKAHIFQNLFKFLERKNRSDLDF